MNKKPSSKQATKTLNKSKVQEFDTNRVHKAINWVVSVILLVFAIWGIKLHTDSKELYFEAQQMVNDTDQKIVSLTNDLKDVKTACSQMVPVDIPLDTNDAKK